MSRARHLYSSPDYPDRTFTATELRHECNVYDKFDVGTAVRAGKPIGGHLWSFAGHVPQLPKPVRLAIRRETREPQESPRDIRCSCPECQGRAWLIPEITALPNYPGGGQAAAMSAAIQAQKDLDQMAVNLKCDAYGVQEVEMAQGEKAHIGKLCIAYGADQVADWYRMAASRHVPEHRAIKYVYGIVRNLQGRAE
jgi:hypothetical protein